MTIDRKIVSYLSRNCNFDHIIYVGYFILIISGNYLEKYEKTFQIKVVNLNEQIIKVIFEKTYFLRLYESHRHFLN